jgi:fatty acid-binding protein DegV
MEECIALAEEARKHVRVVFAVDTLEFYTAGNWWRRSLATALNFKPILEVTNGRVETVDRCGHAQSLIQ